MSTPEKLAAIQARAVVTSESMNKILGLLDAAAAELSQLVRSEDVGKDDVVGQHNKRLLSGLYQGINAERAYVAEYERANRELMPDLGKEDYQNL
jgi:hypothetical protein